MLTFIQRVCATYWSKRDIERQRESGDREIETERQMERKREGEAKRKQHNIKYESILTFIQRVCATY